MPQQVSRRSFVTGAAVSAATSPIIAFSPTPRCEAQQSAASFNRQLKSKRKRLDSEAVEQFVRAAHFDYEKVRQMHDVEPGLVNAVWDWGGGDFESALGAASHMGRRDIALYLLNKGARPNLFTFAMLGNGEIVESVLTAMPNLIHTAGPHGIPLIAHAYAGGPEAQNVVSYLKSNGAKILSKAASQKRGRAEQSGGRED